MNPAQPLAGKTVAVTRASAQAGELAERLEALGAQVLECPLIRVEPVLDCPSAGGPLDQLDAFDWLVFTSSNAVECLARLLEARGLELTDRTRPRIAAVGEGTAGAASRRGWHVQMTAAEAIAESLAADLVARGIAGQRVLFPKARKARETLPSRLSLAGARVEELVVYETVPDPRGADGLRAALEAGRLDVVTLARPSAVEQFHAAIGPTPPGKPHLVSIGPVTTRRAEQLGYVVDATAQIHSLDGLVEAVTGVFTAGAAR